MEQSQGPRTAAIPVPVVRFCIIAPAFNEATSLAELCDRTEAVLHGMGAADDFTLMIVNDGSTDETADTLRRLAETRPFIHVLNLRINCGKSIALMAGFLRARADYVITIDADLQDCPEDIPGLIRKIDEGYDLVSGWRRRRQHSLLRRVGSRVFNHAVRVASGLEIHDFNCGLKAYRGPLVAKLCVYGQYHRYIPVIAHFAGFRVGEVPVENEARKHGATKFRSIRYEGLFDLLSLMFTHKYGLNPLHFFGTVSLLIMVPASLVILWFVVSQLLYLLGAGDAYMVDDRPLLTFAMNGVLIGLIVFITGFVCDFVLHHQIRHRIADIIDLALESESGGGVRGAPTSEADPPR